MDFKDKYWKDTNNLGGIQVTPPQRGNLASAEAKSCDLKDKYLKDTSNVASTQVAPPPRANLAAAEVKGRDMKDQYLKDTSNVAGTQVAPPPRANLASAEELGLNARNNCRKDTSYYGGTQGWLPPCGDLASPYVPMLEPLPERYSHTDALNNGTLFPALNLPFHLKINADNVVTTPLNELQSLEFVITELGLYLDTHPDDEEAFYVYKQYVELEKKVRDAYTTNKGPLFQTDSAKHDSFAWVRDPWPWHLKD